ncbi:hypothetical protein GCM10028819_11560 [Spirosoma humi]
MDDFENRSTAERTIIQLDAFNITDVHRLGRYRYTHAQSGLPEHAHEGMMEICYCEKGLQVYAVDGQEFYVKGGDVFVTFPGELHGTAHHPEEKGALYWLIIKVPTEGPFLDFAASDASALTQALLTLPSRHFKGNRTLKKILDDLFTLYKNPHDSLRRIQIMNLLTSFLLTVIQCSHQSMESRPSDQKIKISQYIRANLHTNLTIDELAVQLNFSDSHFKSWFKKEFGMPPADYILRLRIAEAKVLLQRTGDNTVTETAYQLNFSSSQYFATVFKKYTGVTPTDYRNSLGRVLKAE